eukprot:126248-Chlamydomonas_euryale.AAC.5
MGATCTATRPHRCVTQRERAHLRRTAMARRGCCVAARCKPRVKGVLLTWQHRGEERRQQVCNVLGWALARCRPRLPTAGALACHAIRLMYAHRMRRIMTSRERSAATAAAALAIVGCLLLSAAPALGVGSKPVAACAQLSSGGTGGVARPAGGSLLGALGQHQHDVKGVDLVDQWKQPRLRLRLRLRLLKRVNRARPPHAVAAAGFAQASKDPVGRRQLRVRPTWPQPITLAATGMGQPCTRQLASCCPCIKRHMCRHAVGLVFGLCHAFIDLDLPCHRALQQAGSIPEYLIPTRDGELSAPGDCNAAGDMSPLYLAAVTKKTGVFMGSLYTTYYLNLMRDSQMQCDGSCCNMGVTKIWVDVGESAST